MVRGEQLLRQVEADDCVAAAVGVDDEDVLSCLLPGRRRRGDDVARERADQER